MRTFILLAAGGAVLLAGNAQAGLSMPEREHVQTIAWAVEFAAFFIALAIAWFVWRLIKRDSKNKKQSAATHDMEQYSDPHK